MVRFKVNQARGPSAAARQTRGPSAAARESIFSMLLFFGKRSTKRSKNCLHTHHHEKKSVVRDQKIDGKKSLVKIFPSNED